MKDNEPKEKAASIRALVVDDEIGFRELLQYELGSKGMTVETAENGAEALKMAQKKHFDVIVTDITMPEMDGLKFMKAVKKHLPDIEVIVVTGFGTVETAVYAMQHGASDFLLKPYDMKYLLNCIEKACRVKVDCKSCGRKK